MAVKHSDIAELLTVIEKHVPPDRMRSLLRELQQTNAFLTNQSFRETIRRIMQTYLHEHRDTPPSGRVNVTKVKDIRRRDG